MGKKCQDGILQGMPVRVTLRSVSLIAVAAIAASACGASPTQPTGVEASAYQSAAASAWTGGLVSTTAAAALTPVDLAARGWTCRPIPGGTGCNSPNQGFPSHDTPLEDRPAVFTVLTFDPAGAFIGTATLLRADLYHGQQCESTRAPYTFFPLIGYYFCVRTAGT